MPTAILIDGDFYLRRVRYLNGKQPAVKAATILHRMCLTHLKQADGQHDLYRIFFYDCPPLDIKVHNPITKKAVDFILDPMWANIRADLHEHIDGLRTVMQRPPAQPVPGSPTPTPTPTPTTPPTS